MFLFCISKEFCLRISEDRNFWLLYGRKSGSASINCAKKRTLIEHFFPYLFVSAPVFPKTVHWTVKRQMWTFLNYSLAIPQLLRLILYWEWFQATNCWYSDSNRCTFSLYFPLPLWKFSINSESLSLHHFIYLFDFDARGCLRGTEMFVKKCSCKCLDKVWKNRKWSAWNTLSPYIFQL